MPTETTAKPQPLAVVQPLPRRIQRVQELPVLSFNDWDNVGKVKSAIKEHEAGIFSQSAHLVDAMGRDDRISGVLDTRTKALTGMAMNFEPKGDGRQKKMVAKELEERWDYFYPNSALSQLHTWGVMLGAALGENVWEYGEHRWEPRLKVWHPQALSYRQDTKTYWVQTTEGLKEITPGDGQWILYTPYGLHRGWMGGKVRSLYVPWLIRLWGLRDWARYSEVHGHPIKKAVTPAGVEKEAAKQFLREVAAMGTESVVHTERVANGEGKEFDRYDVELLEALSTGWESFEKLLDKAETCIAVAILGQNLSTEVKGGSFAATIAHMAVRRDVLQSDAENITQCLREQSIGWWALNNFGSAELAPLPVYKTGVRTNEDKTARGTALENLGKGITSLRASGVQVDADKIMEEEEVPVTAKAVEPPPVDEVPADDGAADDVKKTGELPRPKVAASQTTSDTVPPLAAIEGQLYIDRLAEDGIQRFQMAVQADVKKVLSILQDAPDYGTLRQRLLDAYGEMDEETEAELLRQALVMAELAGRFAAKKEAEE